MTHEKKRPCEGYTIGEEHTEGISQLEIARRLGISRARVSFLERRAMHKLRVAAQAKGLSLEDLFEVRPRS